MTETQITDDQIIVCPKCNDKLFMAVFIYAVKETNIIGQHQLAASQVGVKCSQCGQILPMQQLNEFTIGKIKQQAGVTNDAQVSQKALDDARCHREDEEETHAKCECEYCSGNEPVTC